MSNDCPLNLLPLLASDPLFTDSSISPKQSHQTEGHYVLKNAEVDRMINFFWLSFYYSSPVLRKERLFCFLFWALSAAVKLSSNCSRERDEDKQP